MRRAQPWLTNRARVLRGNDTTAEAKLWHRLRNRNLGGFKFIRQAPVGPYFVDFLCREKRFVVEVDGATHATPKERAGDCNREAWLRCVGYQVLRVTNEDVVTNIEGVLEGLLAKLHGASD